LIGDRVLSVGFCARIFCLRSLSFFKNIDERRHFDVVNELRMGLPGSRPGVDFPDNASIALALYVTGNSGRDFSIRANLEAFDLNFRCARSRDNGN
jgi:hypothetical protein